MRSFIHFSRLRFAHGRFLFVSSMGEIPITQLTNHTFMVGAYLMLRTKDLTVW